MKISIIPSDYIIKTVKENEDKTILESIFIVKGIRIKNTFEKKITIKKLQFNLKSKGESRQKISYSKEILSEKAEQFKGLLGFLGVKQDDPIREVSRTGSAQLFMGQETFWNYENFTSSFEMKPGQETGYRLEVFRLVSSKPIDELECSVIYKLDKEKKKESISIPVKIYENKNEYTFPLKGDWLVWGNWDDTTSHRTMHSQEFAFDLVQFNDNLMLPQVGSTPNEDFKMYKKDVLAVADGEVVDCFSESPENPSAPEMLSNEVRREITEKHGLVVVASGNYVIIKHPKDEYSYYAHLATNSVTVKKGDKVKQGQIIGKLGNSGNSTGPHLHFQLMAGPSIFTARGLPCHFTDIVSFTGEKITLIQDSLTVVHTVDE